MSNIGRDIFTDSPSKGLPYNPVFAPRVLVVNPSDQIKPFTEIDKLLAWYYNPKRAFLR